MRSKIKITIAFLMLIVGIGIMLYPIVSRYYSQNTQMEAVQYYTNNVDSMDKDDVKSEFKKAKTYNENLSGAEIHDPFVPNSGYVLPDNYNDVLNISNGIMGNIEIPKIDINVPIYHGTSEVVLAKGIGHIRETSLPIGGKSCHSVLCGHRGLSNAKLFTDLNKLKINDEFYINILDEKHVYKVDQIKVVEPGDTHDMRIIKGKDYITLLTCTPYGINSHRLLIRGQRDMDKETELLKIKNEDQINKNTTSIDSNKTSIIIYFPIIIIILIIVFILYLFIKRIIKK